MNIQQEDNPQGGRFYFSENGNELAGMYYTCNGPAQIIIDHTEVDTSLEGRGVGKLLLAATVEFARKKGLRIFPVCPFAKHVMAKTADYADVLSESQDQQ